MVETQLRMTPVTQLHCTGLVHIVEGIYLRHNETNDLSFYTLMATFLFQYT